MTTLFYFTKSHNGNAGTYAVPLTVARAFYEEVYRGPQAMLAILRSESGSVDFSEKYYRKLKNNTATQSVSTGWGSGSDWYYNFSSDIDPRAWMDIYEQAVLPNYTEREQQNLANKSNQRSPKNKLRTVYDDLSEHICGEKQYHHDKTDEEKDRDNERIERATEYLLDLILADYPSEHIETMRQYIGRMGNNFPFDPANNGTIRLKNTKAEDTINGITAELLAALSHKLSYYWGNRLSSDLLQRIDLENPEYFDKLAQLFDFAVAKHNKKLGHRDIVSRLKKTTRD